MASTTRRLFSQIIGGVLLAVMTACSPLKLLNVLTPDVTYDKTEGIAYGRDPRQKLDVYVPRHPMENAPVVVFFYGGSWNSGSRSDYAFVGEALASRGIVAVLADYRLYRRCVIRCSLTMAPGPWPGPMNTFVNIPGIRSGCT